MPQDKLPEPGEFTRIFKRQHFGPQSGGDEASVSDASGLSKPVEAGVAPVSGQLAAEPSSLPPAPSNEPGEFTRYFTGGLPPQAAKTGPGTTQRTPSSVQRPNTPVAFKPSAGEGSGSFPQRFGNGPASADPPPPSPITEEFGFHNPRLGSEPDLSKRPSAEENSPFNFTPRIPPALPSSQDGPGEYTKLFGKGNTPPPPRASAVAPAPLAPMMGDSPRTAGSVPMAESILPAPSAASTRQGPSEFTVAVNGRQAPPDVSSASTASGGAAPRKLPSNLNVSAANPLAALAGGAGMPSLASSGSIGMSGAHASTPMGSANLQAPHLQTPHLPQMAAPAVKGIGLSKLSDQTKLILFFALLAIASVILVVAVFASQKS